MTRGSALLRLAFFLSGAAGLGYEVVWTRAFSVGLGHEYPSLLAVVAAFFGGVALGAWLSDGVIAKSRRPGRIYALLEVAIGLWSLATLAIVPRVNEAAAGWIGVDPSPVAHWAMAFAIPFLVLLPATAAMGATLPAIERLTARLEQDGQRVAGLYALNTAGAAGGILASHLLLVPRIGVAATLATLAGVNLLCATLVAVGAAPGEADRDEVEGAMDGAPSPRLLGLLAVATGVLGIGFEVLGIRVMSQVLEDTVFTFAAALVAYLIGSAAGAALYQSKAGKRSFVPLFEGLVLGLAGTTALGLLVLGNAGAAYEALRSRLGTGPSGSMAAELALAGAVFLLPAGLMGATFAHLMQAARGRDGGVGRILALNTLGSSLAPLVFGVTLLPLIGTKLSIVLIAACYLGLLPRRRNQRLVWGLPALGLVWFIAPPLLLVSPAGGRVVRAEEGRLASVAAIDLGELGLAHKVNDRFRMGGTGPGMFGARRLGHLPLLLHPEPERALFLGVGTGVTLAAAGAHPGLETTGVELMPEVVELMPEFRDGNAAVLDDPRIDVVAADARRFIQATDERFDVIVADLFHPGRDGAGSLYTQEHFTAIRERLAEGGLFCQWIPLHQVDEEVLALIVRTYLTVFPEAQAFIGLFNVDTPNLALVAGRDALRWPADHFEQRVSAPALSRELSDRGFRTGFQLLGTWVAGAEALTTWAGDAPLNTDDRPRIEYTAPALAYLADDVPGQHTELLVELSSEDPSDLLAAEDLDSPFARDLSAYLTARDLYLMGALARLNGDPLGSRETWLESAAASEHFRTAYQVLLSEAQGLAPSRLQTALELLDRLVELRPENEEAAIVRGRLSRGR
ncbi:MAG: fused MFS/spermidine synthase [Planctomycetota bacterium]